MVPTEVIGANRARLSHKIYHRLYNPIVFLGLMGLRRARCFLTTAPRKDSAAPSYTKQNQPQPGATDLLIIEQQNAQGGTGMGKRLAPR